MLKEDAPVTLQLRNLVKNFGARGDVQAVNHVNIDIRQGEFITLLGPSGCGKTTTLRLIAGFEYPTSGEVIVDGAVINNVPPNKRPMAMVFQSYALFPHLTVFDNVSYGLKIKKMSREMINETVDIAMQLMNLVGMEKRMPHQLSGGQQQRVALARALVMQPRVLLFDEPLSNLDAKLRAQMRTEIHRIHQQLGITSVYVTHDQSEALGLSDRIVIMHNGKVEQIGTPFEIYAQPSSIFVADFVGQANFISTTVQQVYGSTYTCDLLGQPFGVKSHQHAFAVGEVAYLVFRPESVSFYPTPGSIDLEGIVRRVEYLGSRAEYEIEVDGWSVSVNEEHPRLDNLKKPGDPISIHITTDTCHLLPLPEKHIDHPDRNISTRWKPMITAPNAHKVHS